MMRDMNTLVTPSPTPSDPAVIAVFGISNCDSVKKARRWLAQQGVAYAFHDFKKGGVPADQLPSWIATLGWEKLLNRKGTTWRQLDATAQAAVVDVQSASALMLAQPSVIKRPVIDWGRGRISVGFDIDSFTASLP
ncbi:MAG: arsenate reductase [Rhodoferax sp.]|jgi:arsenate reductase